jgi:hypothetical protein
MTIQNRFTAKPLGTCDGWVCRLSQLIRSGLTSLRFGYTVSPVLDLWRDDFRGHNSARFWGIFKILA